MTSPLAKMRIKAPHVLYAWNAPKDFEHTIGTLPDGIRITRKAPAAYNSLHWFVKNKAAVEKETPAILEKLKPGVTAWCYFPKRSGGIQTDLTRDKGWESLLQHDLKWLSLVSFDDTWSAFAFRLKTDEEKTEAPAAEREIHKYADSTTKTITLPEDLSKALDRNKAAQKAFEALAFSHRREYVEWVVTAKKEETRAKRIAGTIEMLLKGKKNPADKQQ